MNTQILVVDDEENIRNIIKARLERNNHKVVTASDAEDALKSTAIVLTSLYW